MTVFGPVTFRPGGVWGFGQIEGLPVNGPIASPFGDPRPGGPHSGIDIAAPTGTPIVAPAAAEVVRVDTQGIGSSGKHVVLRHADGMTSAYYHMSAPASLITGQQIAVGTFLGASGNTGNSTGPHLHWGVFAAGTSTPVDPLQLIDGAVSINRGTFVAANGIEAGITPAVWQGGSVAELTAAAKREGAASVTVFVDGRPLDSRRTRVRQQGDPRALPGGRAHRHNRVHRQALITVAAIEFGLRPRCSARFRR